MVNLAEKHTLRKKLLIAAAGLLLIAGASYGGWRAYRKWEPPRLARRAHALIEKGDWTNASLTMRHAFSINPGDIPTNRLAAEICEDKGNPEAVVWRRRLVDLESGSLQAVLDCAEAALRFGKPAAGKNALEKVEAAGKADARYHETFGRTLMALGESTRAIEEFAAALRIEPQNESYQLEYAAAMVDRGWLEDRSLARSNLQRLSAMPTLRLRALRTLVRDAMANHELTSAAGLAHELAAQPDAQFTDQMVLLDLLRSTMALDFSSTLETLKTAARGKPPQLTELLNWMTRNGRSSEAIEWAVDFSSEDWYDPNVCAAVALNIFAAQSWEALELFTEEGNWQRLEYIRCALLARALREQGKFTDAQQQWKTAVGAAAHVPRATGELTRMIANWGWEIQYAELLHALLKDPKEATWAAQTLLPILARKKDTVGLWEATGRFMDANANSDAAANNFAMYSLLLGRDVTHASELAGKLYEKHRHEGNYVSTYAYSLHVRGQTEEALRVMASLSPQQFESPDIAVYYGILLAATRDWVRAPRFLDLAKRATLLPEEEALIRTARNEVDEARSEPE
jgi:tetratricopeptide (TPR) repeat protein